MSNVKLSASQLTKFTWKITTVFCIFSMKVDHKMVPFQPRGSLLLCHFHLLCLPKLQQKLHLNGKGIFFPLSFIAYKFFLHKYFHFAYITNFINTKMPMVVLAAAFFSTLPLPVAYAINNNKKNFIINHQPTVQLSFLFESVRNWFSEVSHCQNLIL